MNHKRLHRVYREPGLNRRKKRKHCGGGQAAAGADFGQPGVGSGFCARRGGVRTGDPGAGCGGRLHPAVSGIGGRYEFCQPASYTRAGSDHRSAGSRRAIRCDNGPELTSRHFLAWGIEWKIDLVHIQPGKPTQNAQVESFNGRLREECLNMSWFWNLFDARRKIAAWRIDTTRASAQQLGLQNAERVCGAGSRLLHG